MMTLLITLYAFCVFALLMAELRGQDIAQRIFKPAAGVGFLLLAVLSGALETLYGQLIMIALVFSVVGDTCLLKRGVGGAFMAGMTAFAAAHLAYILALAQWGFSPIWLVWLIPAGGIGFASFYMMKTVIPATLRQKTLLYSVIIAVMGAFAILASYHSGHGLFVIASGCFILSDIFVSRHRFKPVAIQKRLKGARNFAIITPFYFFAQALFALSTGLL